MLKSSVHVAAVVAALALPSVLQAATIDVRFVDVYSTNTQLSSNSDEASYSHYLTAPPSLNLTAYLDSVATSGEGFNSSTDTLQTGSLTLSFSSISGNARFNLLIGGSSVLSNSSILSTVEVALTGDQLTMIAANNSITVLVDKQGGSGSAAFTRSVLDVSGVRQIADENGGGGDNGGGTGNVAEPASLVLLGLGLLGAGTARRRTRQ